MYAKNKAIQAVSLLPPAIVLGLFGYEWYVYNLVFALNHAQFCEEGAELLFFLARVSLFNALWFLALWSYFRAMLTEPGMIPEEWREFIQEWESLGKAGGRRQSGTHKWSPQASSMCWQCNRRRPERAHHCSICGHCFMRMDHHCPWIANCVGFKNQKYFILMTFWGALACFCFAASAIPQLKGMLFHSGGRFKEPGLDAKGMMAFSMGAVLSASFCIALGVLFISHVWLLMNNLTSIEVGNFGRNQFSLDWISNMEQLLGAPDLTWLIPVPPLHPVSDGLAFPTKDTNTGGVRRAEVVDRKSVV